MGRRWWRSGYSTKEANELGKSLSLDPPFPPFMPFKPSEFPRIPLPRTRVNKGKSKGQGLMPRPLALRLPGETPVRPTFSP
jgi:hypothetical protein